MRRFDDPIVPCPFDASHRLQEPRLQWHLLKCPARTKHAEEGKPVFHCPNNFLHIYFTEADLQGHMAVCPSRTILMGYQQMQMQQDQAWTERKVDDWGDWKVDIQDDGDLEMGVEEQKQSESGNISWEVYCS